MNNDVLKHLERAKKYLEKNKLQDAIDSYRAVLDLVPNHQESIQALGDLYTRINDPTRAAQYYGMLFDRLAEIGDTTKASALYARFLKGVQQSPERMMRFGMLLQRQNRRDEAVDFYTQAGEAFLERGSGSDALACFEKIAAIDPENPERHVKLGEIGERFSRGDIASRGYLRAGQLVLSTGNVDRALDLLGRAMRLAPGDRTVALFLAHALLSKGTPRDAVRLLEPLWAADADAEFLTVLGTALLQDGQLDRARPVLDQLYIERPEDFSLLFDLADAFFQNQAEDRGVALLDEIKQRMFSARRSSEFTAQLDRLADVHRSSIPLAEFGGRVYDELNRESKYFTYLTRLFDLYSASRNFQGACNSLDRIVDIDPYDADNNSRLAQLEGNVDPAYLRGVAARLGKTVSAQSNFTVGLGEESRAARSGTAAPLTEEARARQQLEDLIVQAEIFLQYSLHQKAVERLQSIAQQFPGEEDKNARLRNLYDLANWHPPSTRKQEVPIVEAKSAATIAQTGSFSGETLRDLGKVSEITRLIHRQSTPKAVMTAAVGEIGKYLRVTRCLAVFGTGAQETLLSAEYTVSGLPPVTDEEIRRLAAALSEMPPDASGVCALDAVREPFLRQLTLDSVTAAPLNDRESQSTAGMLIIGDAAPRKWKPNEGYFLQAVGDQVLIGVNHTRLRSLMRNLAVADEKTGLLSRGSYQDCLLSESNRMKSQNTPLSLLLLSIDRGPELLRQYGEQQIEKHMEQMARALQPSVRQTDIPIKYTSWALAFVLTDTRLVAALQIADKLRKAAAAVAPPWNGGGLTVSASVVEAVSRPDFESEDIVTDLMNRAEFGLEEARKKGGDSIQSL